MTVDNNLVMILAGGEGKRLYPLTKDRAKPAVPFGGRYRIIDFVLNNFINSGFYKIKVLTQYKSDSLNKHITRGWALSPFLDQYVDLCPAQMRTGNDWYKGTADAIYQNIFHITDENPRYVCIFGGDHIYKMHVDQMLDFHKQNNADLTISGIPIPIDEASEFGIMEVDDNWRLINFVEKPNYRPKSIPGNPEMCLASMGNYIFNKDVLLEALNEDSKKEENKQIQFEPIFGHMDMFFGMMRTKYDDSRHSLFYPHPQWGGFIGVNYNWLRKYLSLGLQTKFGFYKDRGHPSISKDVYNEDMSTKLTRPLFPLQASFTLGFSPFVKKMWIIPKKLLTIRGWCGFEYLYGQEQRTSGDEDAYVDKIRLSSMVYGISPWFLISFFDQQTARYIH